MRRDVGKPNSGSASHRSMVRTVTLYRSFAVTRLGCNGISYLQVSPVDVHSGRYMAVETSKSRTFLVSNQPIDLILNGFFPKARFSVLAPNPFCGRNRNPVNPHRVRDCGRD